MKKMKREREKNFVEYFEKEEEILRKRFFDFDRGRVNS